ncbi:L,D-transpeptidase family protein [Microbulbifer sp. SAOS-129_SWC]|uniref:L,D-transpeptidase family protein n=1 Tax=Microbulbifer sp. SAOS-129_SWC TaxID=3145235 RepID=UPI00321695E1
MSYFNPERRKRKSLLPLLLLGSLCVFALYYAFSANQKTVPVLPENAVRPHLVRWLEKAPESWPAQDPIFNPAAVRRIYERTDYRLLWFDNYSLSDTANDLLKQLTASSSGNPSSMVDYRYHLGYFDRTLRDTPQKLQMAAVLDVLLTDAFVSYARDTQLDKLNPKSRPRRNITPVNGAEGGFQLVGLIAARQGSEPSGRRYFRGYTRGADSEKYSDSYQREGRASREQIDRSRHYSSSSNIRYNRPTYNNGYSAGRTSNERFAAGGLPPRNAQRDYRHSNGLPPIVRAGASENSEGPYIEEYRRFGGEAAALRSELARMRQIAASGMWRPLPPGPAMTIGAKHPHVALLRNMLALYGDYRSYSGEYNSDKFDRRLHDAVIRFQTRHGLKPDGIVGRATRQRLNLSPTARAQIIESNIRRREQLPTELGSRFIQVNVPEYKLHYVENGIEKLTMNVVVGKKKHATPEITTRVSKVIFNPTWTVPRSILVNELLPKARANPSGMQDMGYRVVNASGENLPLTPKNLSAAGAGSYLMRQMGGEDNILGRVKFEIPNKYDVYLHDTRARTLFTLTNRDYSHGCIRLQSPRHLAEALLRPQGDWDQWRIDDLIAGGDTTEVKMEERVPVYITYWTAWVDGEGRLNFRPDIYDKDGLMANQR